MNKIEVEIDDKYSFEICTQSRVILIKEYKDECIMTINYPENWAYSRALQHGLSIIQSSIDNNIK